MTDAENGSTRGPGAAHAAEDQRLAQEIAHKEELLAAQFAEDGQRTQRIRRNEWFALVAVVIVLVSILIATVR